MKSSNQSKQSMVYRVWCWQIKRIPWVMAMLIVPLGCAIALDAKAPIAEQPVVQLPNVVPKEEPDDLVRPLRTVGELLAERLVLCENAETKAADASELEAQLNDLMRASCRPEATPGALNRMIAQLAKLGTWPADYAGLFDLLIANQKAYALVDRLYTDLQVSHRKLQRSHRNLKRSHERTIEGLGDIEADIEEQTAPPTSAVPEVPDSATAEN